MLYGQFNFTGSIQPQLTPLQNTYFVKSILILVFFLSGMQHYTYFGFFKEIYLLFDYCSGL